MPKRRPARPATAAKAAPPARRDPTYDDILAIARLIESGSRFSEFRLRSGDIEVEVKRANGAAVRPRAGGDPVTPAAVRRAFRTRRELRKLGPRLRGGDKGSGGDEREVRRTATR